MSGLSLIAEWWSFVLFQFLADDLREVVERSVLDVLVEFIVEDDGRNERGIDGVCPVTVTGQQGVSFGFDAALDGFPGNVGLKSALEGALNKS